MGRVGAIVVVALIAVTAGCNAHPESEALSGQLDDLDCQALNISANVAMANFAGNVGETPSALKATTRLVQAKRKAYQGGCMSRGDYVKFLGEKQKVSGTMNCPKCLNVFERELAALHVGG
jgi:hypothetical protein